MKAAPLTTLPSLTAPSLSPILIPSSFMKSKVHNFTQYKLGQDYVIEPISNEVGEKQFYITAQGKGVQCSDYLVLQNGTKSTKYRVEEIDYYCNPSDIWVALLTQVQ